MRVCVLKNWLIAALTTAQVILEPAKPMFLSVLFLIVVDLITGILAARKRNESINSAGIGRTVAKLVIYEAAICAAFIAETYLTGSLIPASKITASLIGTAELLSVLENLNALSNGELLKTLIDKLTSIGKQ